MKEYDTIIIGAGLAGLTLASILTAKEKQRVLVLEKEDYTGGRIVSFTGSDKGFNLQGKSINESQYKNILGVAHSRLFDSSPALYEIINNKLLNGYSFEAGIHITFWGNKGKLAAFFDYMGRHVDFPGNEGFAVLDADTDIVHELIPGSKYGWMNDESVKITRALLKEMATAGQDEIDRWRTISFGEWMRQRTVDQKAWEFLSAVASPHMAMGDPDMMNAGEFIQFMSDAGKIGMNFISGSTGIVSKPGFIHLADILTEIIKENGGEISLNSHVEQVQVSGGIVTGVKYKDQYEEKTVLTKNAVCTLPPRRISGIFPENAFPAEFARYIKEDFWGPGIVTSYTGLKSNLFQTAGLNPKSWVIMPAYIKSSEGFKGDVDCSFIIQSSYSASLAPEGKSLLTMGVCLTEEEISDSEKVKYVFSEAEKHFGKAFPSFEEEREWSLYTAGPGCYGDWPPVHCKRPPNSSPWIKGLYFAGDSYGEKVKGSGMDSALHSAIDCADDMTGRDYLTKIFPEYLK
jgi:hypothetical protein